MVETIFVTPGLQKSYPGSQILHLPMHYSAFWKRLSQPGFINCVIINVPKPAKDGTIGFGLTADFAAPPHSSGGAVNWKHIADDA